MATNGATSWLKRFALSARQSKQVASSRHLVLHARAALPCPDRSETTRSAWPFVKRCTSRIRTTILPKQQESLLISWRSWRGAPGKELARSPRPRLGAPSGAGTGRPPNVSFSNTASAAVTRLLGKADAVAIISAASTPTWSLQ